MQIFRRFAAFAFASTFMCAMATAQNSPPVSVSPTQDGQTTLKSTAETCPKDKDYFCDVAVAVAPGDTATASHRSPEVDAQAAADQAKFNAASELYVQDIGYFNDAVVKLRAANQANNGMSCTYADLAVVTLGSAQNHLKTMIDLVEDAYQDSTAWRKDYDDNAAQLVLRKDALHRNCG